MEFTHILLFIIILFLFGILDVTNRIYWLLGRIESNRKNHDDYKKESKAGD